MMQDRTLADAPLTIAESSQISDKAEAIHLMFCRSPSIHFDKTQF
jgi:hypothetical protein